MSSRSSCQAAGSIFGQVQCQPSYLFVQAMIALPEVLDNSQDPPRNDLRDFLVGVPLEGEQRKEVIDTLGKEVNMRQETINFLKLLVDTNRLDCIDDIITVFEERYNTLTDTQV
jgi:F0F1-type ATP synthase delta subunit